MATGLATRCPACDTAFRVVVDQLRVSDGWVRCGRCSEVFNAGERLIDVESGAPLRMPEPASAAEAATVPPPPLPADVAADDAKDEFAFDAIADHARAGTGPASSLPAHFDEGVDRFEIAHDGPPSSGDTEPAPRTEPPPVDDSELRAEPAAMPSFVRRADRAQRWRHPAVRAGLSLLLLLGVLGLAGQVTYVYRDRVSAQVEPLRPLLAQACAALDCRIGPPHLIDNLAVDSSGLVRVEKSNIYRLSVTLRNRSAIETALPAFDLALTDSQGRLLARRVLRAPELGASQAGLGAGRDLALQATLQSTTDPVAGYTIELFYP